MQIKNHRLLMDDEKPYPFRSTPNKGGRLDHKYLIMHYTAGSSAEESIDWLTNAVSRASAHVVIGRDGAITQLVPFNEIAWHAGESRWAGLQFLNQFSIGIELDNAGLLERSGNFWRAWFGGRYDDSEVVEAEHKNDRNRRVTGWHAFTTKQIEVALELASLLVETYTLKDVLGHDDIAPHRKVDPGPAFPMRSFRARVMGRNGKAPTLYKTSTGLFIRAGAGTHYDSILGPGNALPKDTMVEFLEQSGNWWFVNVLDTVQGVMDLQGWVHSYYLETVEE